MYFSGMAAILKNKEYQLAIIPIFRFWQHTIHEEKL